MDVLVGLGTLLVVVFGARFVISAAEQTDAPTSGSVEVQAHSPVTILPPIEPVTPMEDPPALEVPVNQPRSQAIVAPSMPPSSDIIITPFRPTAGRRRSNARLARHAQELTPPTGLLVVEGADPGRLIQAEVLVPSGSRARAMAWMRLAAGIAVFGAVMGFGLIAGFRGLVVFFKAL